jgi:hypothetical protein
MVVLEVLLAPDMAVVVEVAQEQLEVTEQQLQVGMGVTELHPLYQAHPLLMLVAVVAVAEITLPALLEQLLVLVEQAVVVQVLSILVVMQLPELQILAVVAVAVVHQVLQIRLLAVLEAQAALG